MTVRIPGKGHQANQKRTSSACPGMSEKCQQETYAPQQIAKLFDQFIGGGEQWLSEARSSIYCRFGEIERQFESPTGLRIRATSEVMPQVANQKSSPKRRIASLFCRTPTGQGMPAQFKHQENTRKRHRTIARRDCHGCDDNRPWSEFDVGCRAPVGPAPRGHRQHCRNDDRMVRLPHLQHGDRAGLQQGLLPWLRPLGRHAAGVRRLLRRLRRAADRSRDLRPLRRSDRPQGDPHRHLADDRDRDRRCRASAGLRLQSASGEP